jgi:excisionase family DNA binding protein
MMAPAMTQQPVTFHQVAVSEAACILGVSTQTVRRMLRRGQLEGERVHRAQGSAYVVKLPVDNTAGDTDATATQQPAGNVSRANATAQRAPAEAIAAMIQATLTPVIAPLVGELAATRQVAERRADAIAELREERGRLTAELERAASTVVMLGEELDALKAAQASPMASTPGRRSWGRWWPLWAILAALVVAGLLLAWPH